MPLLRRTRQWYHGTAQALPCLQISRVSGGVDQVDDVDEGDFDSLTRSRCGCLATRMHGWWLIVEVLE